MGTDIDFEILLIAAFIFAGAAVVGAFRLCRAAWRDWRGARRTPRAEWPGAAEVTVYRSGVLQAEPAAKRTVERVEELLTRGTSAVDAELVGDPHRGSVGTEPGGQGGDQVAGERDRLRSCQLSVLSSQWNFTDN